MFVRILLFILTSALLWGQNTTTSPNAAADLAKQVADMNAVIQKLQQRVDELEARLGSTAAAERAGKPEIAQANQAVSATFRPTFACGAAIQATFCGEPPSIRWSTRIMATTSTTRSGVQIVSALA